MNRFAALAIALLLVGCATPGTPTTDREQPELSPFYKPAGTPRSPRVGFILPSQPAASLLAVSLLPNAGLRPGDILVSRNQTLAPTALLIVEELQGHIAVVKLLRGQPGTKDEAVLPTAELRKAAETLPLAGPGS